MAVGLLILRLAWLTIASHGAQKLFGWFGGHGLRGTAGLFETIGLRPGLPNARWPAWPKLEEASSSPPAC